MNRKRREEGEKVKVTVAYLMHNHPTGELLCTVSVKTVLFCEIYLKPENKHSNYLPCAGLLCLYHK